MNDLDQMFEQDIHSVFLSDFSQMHKIGLKTVKCVIDKNIDSENHGRVVEPIYGIYKNTLTVYVKTGEIRKPEADETLSVDGSFHRVLSVSDEQGMLVIVLEENEE